MPIFVGKEYNGSIISVLLANSYELANAYWQGKGIYPHTIDQRSEADLIGHPTGVLPIINTKEVHSHHLSPGAVIRVIE